MEKIHILSRCGKEWSKMKEQTAKFFFGPDNHLPPLGIVSLEGATELSDKIEAHLARWAQQAGRKAETFRIPCS